MKVIFLKDVPRVGRKYDIKDVADGFALNSLIPRKQAVPATPLAIQKITAEKSAKAGAETEKQEMLRQLGNATKESPLTITAAANAQGHLFKGVGVLEIVAALKAVHHLELLPREVLLAHPLKEVGVHIVPLKVGTATGECTISISAA